MLETVQKSSVKSGKKSKKRKKEFIFVISLLITMLCVIILMLFNMIRVGLKSSKTGDTVAVDKKNAVKNELYAIGNNPTEIQQKYFKELTSALAEKNELAMSEDVVKCFIADYYTWTNKDGNYEVGGIQYIYGSKYASFEQESRWKFYKDFDVYLSQYGRDNLLEVKEVEITSPAVKNGEYQIFDHTFDSYYLEAKWSYQDSKQMSTDGFQTKAYFYVINNNGRMEIAEIVNP